MLAVVPNQLEVKEELLISLETSSMKILLQGIEVHGSLDDAWVVEEAEL